MQSQRRLGIGRGTGYLAGYRVYPAQVGVRVRFLNLVNTPTPSTGTAGIYGNYHTIKACNQRMGIKALTQSFGATESFCKCSTPSASPRVLFPSARRQTRRPNFLYKSTSTESDGLPVLSDTSPNHRDGPESQPWQPIRVKSIPKIPDLPALRTPYHLQSRPQLPCCHACNLPRCPTPSP
jgi:hypothetical protein